MKFNWKSPLDWLVLILFVVGAWIGYYTCTLRHP